MAKWINKWKNELEDLNNECQEDYGIDLNTWDWSKLFYAVAKFQKVLKLRKNIGDAEEKNLEER